MSPLPEEPDLCCTFADNIVDMNTETIYPQVIVEVTNRVNKGEIIRLSECLHKLIA